MVNGGYGGIWLVVLFGYDGMVMLMWEHVKHVVDEYDSNTKEIMIGVNPMVDLFEYGSEKMLVYRNRMERNRTLHWIASDHRVERKRLEDEVWLVLVVVAPLLIF